MITLTDLKRLLDRNPQQIFQTTQDLNLYSSPDCDSLVTQLLSGHHLRFSPDLRKNQSPNPVGAQPVADLRVLLVRSIEDHYPGLLALADLQHLTPSKPPVPADLLDRSHIEPRLAAIIDYCQAALMVPNEYLWGGTIAPHYDCSGLMQTAFHSQGIQLPRDAYQQEAFAQAIPCSLTDLQPLQPGDLIFFGTPEKATHVGLYLGQGRYLHSSGKAGRNGIAIDTLVLDSNAPVVSHRYAEQFRGAGRVVTNYRPNA
jgi:NlpC/P60 family/Bacterial dipeptidyl-peptidase Sh3 domain